MRNQNLNFFKKGNIELYDEYHNYQPKNNIFKFDRQNRANIFEESTKNFLYKKNHEELSTEQTNDFFQNPNQITITLERSDSTNSFFKEPEIIDGFFDHIDRKKMRGECNESNEDLKEIGFLIIIGIGLGEHIKALVEKYHIRHLILIEPDPDIFYASLHTIDWQKISQHLPSPKHSLNLFINKNPLTILNNLTSLYNTKGQINAVKTYLFCHTICKKTKETISFLKKNYANTINNQGFIEDEHLSISHNLNNLNQNISIISKIKSKSDTPCIICGNGPSLDDSIPHIKKRLKDFIVISCGSTLGTLLKADIIPDIHIELERTVMTTDSILSLNIPKEVFQNVLFIGFNSVPPETFSLFSKKIMALNSCDSGSEALLNWLGVNLPVIAYCNPTVTNAGISVMLHLGFQEIYLAGVDLGCRDAKIHHALSSAYYEENNKPFETYLPRDNTIECKGNFRQTVYSNPELIQSNINISQAISLYKNIKI